MDGLSSELFLYRFVSAPSSSSSNVRYRYSGTETKCLNLASYNYLGFASNSGACANNTIQTIQEFGLASASPRRELGTTALHIELEQLTAKFLSVEDAIVFGMGFATNGTMFRL